MKPIFFDSNEIDPWTGQPYTFDSPNPNVTVDGVREEGDPGFVPYPTTVTATQPHKRTKAMKHQAYYPTNVPEQLLWLTNFFLKLLIHGPGLGLSALEIADAVADCRWLIYMLGTYRPAERAAAKANTDFIRDVQFGTGTTVMVVPDFEPPPMPANDPDHPELPAVTPRKPGALNRIFSLVQILKERASDTIATDLRIVGPEAPTPPPIEDLQPAIKVKRVSANVFIDWNWDGLRDVVDMLQIQVDRGQGWTDLVYDTTPGYTDPHPHPAALTTWKYRAIWRIGEAQAGLWSPEQGIVVGGGS